MGGLKFFDELEHVIMFPADDPIPPHFGRITGRDRDGDRIVVHVQPDEQDGRFAPGRGNGYLALDRLGLEEYVTFHGVCFPFCV
jgi:hypothetical protein